MKASEMDGVRQRRQLLARLTPRQQAELVELVDKRRYTLEAAYAVAKQVGTQIRFWKERTDV